jgi:hypothetical protein
MQENGRKKTQHKKRKYEAPHYVAFRRFEITGDKTVPPPCGPSAITSRAKVMTRYYDERAIRFSSALTFILPSRKANRPSDFPSGALS